MLDTEFIKSINVKEKNAWLRFKSVADFFLRNKKSEDYRIEIKESLKNSHKLGFLMSLKLHFLESHSDYFTENLGDSEKQGERFHQALKLMEHRYQGTRDANMLSAYCLNQKRDLPEEGIKMYRKTLRRSFRNKRVRYHREKW